MRWAIGIGLFFCITAINVHADSMYIKDIRISVRTTKEFTGDNVVTYLPAGENVEVIESDGGWAQVRLSDGRSGWIRAQYLTDERPKHVLTEIAEKEYGNVSERIKTLDQENKQLKAENQKLSKELGETHTQLTQINSELEALKNESEVSEYLKLKSEYQKALSTFEEQKRKLATLEQELTRLQKDQLMRWFLMGAGVLLVGFLIGFFIKGGKKRSFL